jgi:glycosyltransferase involved in cell wall biosynthesis
MKIKLFTFWYPFGNEEQFLHEEVAYLASRKVDLTVVPFEVKGQIRELPDSINVDTSLAKKLKQNSELKVYPLFRNFGAILKAVFQHKVRSVSGLRDVVGFTHHGKIIRDWASQNVEENEVLYTYWFERITYGLAEYLTSAKLNNVLVTRAHGYDVYSERRNHNFIPFREMSFRRLDQVFTISEDGRNYLVEKFGFEDTIKKAHLGIVDHGVSVAKPDGVIRIVSCSSIIPLKRVDLIARVIKSFCEQNPSKKVKWNHFGGGNSAEVKNEIVETPTNLKVVLHGTISNEKLLDFYKANYIHFFINLSTSEGIPVSIMEAISFGIPVLAPNVGGVSEIVNESTGVLLNPAINFQETNESITYLLKNEDLRKSARKFFKENFVAERNYRSFYNQLKSLNA